MLQSLFFYFYIFIRNENKHRKPTKWQKLRKRAKSFRKIFAPSNLSPTGVNPQHMLNFTHCSNIAEKVLITLEIKLCFRMIHRSLKYWSSKKSKWKNRIIFKWQYFCPQKLFVLGKVQSSWTWCWENLWNLFVHSFKSPPNVCTLATSWRIQP